MFINERSHPIPCISKNNMSTAFICLLSFVFRTLCVLRNALWVFNFCVSFALLSEQSRNNRSEWFANVAQISLYISLSINPSAELVRKRFELKMHNIQLIFKDITGSNSFSQFVCNFSTFFFSSFLWLSLTENKSFWFCNDFLVFYLKNHWFLRLLKFLGSKHVDKFLNFASVFVLLFGLLHSLFKKTFHLLYS